MVFILLYIVIIFTVIEINVVFFTLTGLDRHISRFQVISMLTGTGFTTNESELIIQHPIRRKLGAFLILFGAFSLAVIISSISSMLSKNLFTKEISYIAVALLLIMGLLKIPPWQKKLAKRFTRVIKKTYDLEELPVGAVFLNEKDDFFTEVVIHPSSQWIDQTFNKQLNKEEDVNLLFIKRGEIRIRMKRLSTPFQAGDILYLLGSKHLIKKMFSAELAAEQQKQEKTSKTTTF